MVYLPPFAVQGTHLLTDDELVAFGAWQEQLVAESSGKNGMGIVPVDVETQLPPRNYGRDRLFVYMRLTGSLDAQVKKLQAAGHPALVLPIRDVYDLGAEIYRWETTTAVACAVLGVNAFNQPDVQDNKKRTQQKISAFQNAGSLEESPVIWEGEGGRVYGQEFQGLNGAKTLADVVEAFLQQATAGALGSRVLGDQFRREREVEVVDRQRRHGRCKSGINGRGTACGRVWLRQRGG